MDEKRRTLTYTVVALVSLGAAVGIHLATRPKPHQEFELVGQEFYKDFTDPNEARSLRVAAFDDDTATYNEFNVEFKDGLWRIPSHHDYPADAEDRLAQTAASVIGITRGALVSRRTSEHVRYGVFDPLSDDATVLQGRGQRITLKKEDGTVLADYIIGHEIEDRDGYYYVRVPDEEETYIAELNIDLSTKFSDWIESDLLKVDRDNITKIVVDKYSIDEARGRVVAGERNVLTRTSWSDPWKLEDLDEEQEELETDVVREMVNDLDDLKIVGVRPKPPGLKPDLSIDQDVIRNQLELNAIVTDMMSKGFFISQDQKLVSNEGEVEVATNNGVLYALHFGEIFSGSGLEIEVGFTKDNQDEASNGDSEQDAGQAGDANAESESSESTSDESAGNQDETDANGNNNLKRNRYLFIRASFDPELIGERPEKPVEPQKPDQLLSEKADAAADGSANAGAVGNAEPASDGATTQPDGTDPADVDSQQATQDAAGAAESGENPSSSGDSADDTPAASGESPDGADSPGDAAAGDGENPAGEDEAGAAGETGESNAGQEQTAAEENEANKEDQVQKEEAQPKDPQAEYEQALEQYKQDLEEYENDLSEYEDKLKQGREKVDELNERFGAWYYVISAESFENLRLSREDLVKPKESEDDENADAADEPNPQQPSPDESNPENSAPETGEESAS